MPSQAALARLREIRRKVGERITVDMDVPGYQGMLVARFGPLPWDVVEKGIGNTRRTGGTFPTVAADALAHAIVGFYYRNPDGTLQPLEYPDGEPVVRFDKSLADALGIEHAETGREIVYAVYATGESALIDQYDDLWNWTNQRPLDEDTIEEATADDGIGPLSASLPKQGSSG